ncbi:uncharacterized protein N7483_007081 [Penicillium malachiteum]|uniref:uncharacterized protein n=1 Tax=Penicillium malachiteum TaxID=1324776 RepID=UPI0025471967|nr:uncharacterized protein N7483_007081 [Penicillium malachiteum]KAJ5725724.1 hypothetical protein N7483_007081 [Penicillium malachiteum]
MTFLICPPWRKERHSSPEVSNSNQGAQPGSFQAQNQEPVQPEKKPSESLSRILRRRFSRESKTSNVSRGHGKSIFPFVLKTSKSVPSRPKPDLTALENYGSSLMSERGYDSDAQYITTPRRGDHLGRSPGSRPFRRMELSDLIEQSQERSEAERWALENDRDVSQSQESAFGMHFIPTPPSTLRGPPTTFHTALDTDESKVQPVGSLTDDQPQTEPVMNANYMSRDRYGLASSESLPGPSTNLVVPKIRQDSHSARSFTDPRSVHLSELGISNKLAFHSQSSQIMSCGPSLTQLVRPNRAGLFTNSSQENIQLRQKGSASALSVNEQIHKPTGLRDVSSCYSQVSPSSGNVSLGDQSVRNLTQKAPNKSPGIQETMSSESEVANIPAPRNTLLSRFREHCDPDSPISPQSQSLAIGHVSPRKISIGWMSGGRRVGYGYSPVPAKGAESPKNYEQVTPQLSQIMGLKAEFAKSNEAQGLSQSHVRLEEVRRASARHYTPPSPDIPPKASNEASTVPRSAKSATSNRGYTVSVSPHLRAIFNRSSQERGSTTGLTEESTRDLCAPELTAAVQTEFCQIPQSSHYTSQGQGGDSFAHQWARLSRSMNTQSRSPKTTHNAVFNQEQTPQDGAFSVDRLEAIEPSYLQLDSHNEHGNQAHEPQFNPSRAARWARRFSRYRESRKPSNNRQQESSFASSGPYQDCDSTNASLKRAISTKSNTTDDADCLEMPGSFEGSRWASRISRML